jgi:hypothetical protein
MKKILRNKKKGRTDIHESLLAEGGGLTADALKMLNNGGAINSSGYDRMESNDDAPGFD